MALCALAFIVISATIPVASIAAVPVARFDRVAVTHAAVTHEAEEASLIPWGTGPLGPVSVGIQTIRVATSPGYETYGQSVPAILGGLLHGAEMSGLTVRVVSPEGAISLCNAPACFFSAEDTIVIPGIPMVGGMPFAMALAHEYGHHIAAMSSNAPWPALDWGTKRWATAEHVCTGVRSGAYAPGDQGARYWDNPGEAFAQSYAFSQFPNVVPWWWHLPAPDSAILAALRADVLHPWRPRHSTLRMRAPKRGGSASAKVKLALDGAVAAKVRRPDSGKLELSLRAATGARLAHSKAAGRWVRLRYTTCQRGPVRLSLAGNSGGERVRVRLTTP